MYEARRKRRPCIPKLSRRHSGHQLRQFRGNHEQHFSFARELIEQLVNFRLRAVFARGLVNEQHVAGMRDRLCEATRLQGLYFEGISELLSLFALRVLSHGLASVGMMHIVQFMLDWSQCSVVERVPGKVGGAWLFKGTRIPVRALFENLEGGATVEDFIAWFPGVTRLQADAVLEHAQRSLAEV